MQIKISYTQNNKEHAMEMDHRSLPLDVQCRAAEVELGQRVHEVRLLLV